MKYSVTALFLLAILGLAGVEVSAQKKPLDHSVYDSWQSVKSSMMSADGQVLVYQDMLGMFTDYVPKFVKQFANVGEVMTGAFRDYMDEVQSGAFPSEAHAYVKSDCSDEFLAMLDATM